ncbi:MAG: aldo/keto reductase [Rhodospirillales bacterium]|nr:aldo/keto reductase [Rhodospirillales bacterium]
MKYRRLGKTGLQISEIVFGGGFVGGILIDPDDDTKREAIRRAQAAGVNWIDTAASYGQGQSEQALGWLLAELEQQPHVSTKVGLDVDHLDDIAGQIERSLHASLQRLNKDSVDLLQLHNQIGTQVGGRTIQLEHALQAADGLERMREQGLINHIGFTALGDGAVCKQVVNSGRFDTAQVYYNLINPSAGWKQPRAWDCHDFTGLLEACANNDVGVMNIRVFAAGILVTETRHGREIPVTTNADQQLEEQRARRVLDALGITADGTTPHGTRSQTAIRFALSNPGLACSVVGMAELAHLDQAVAASDMGPLPADALAALERLYDQP